MEKRQHEKSCEIKGGSPEVAVMGRIMVKFLITTIQVNLVPILSEAWRRQHKFT